jgi:hypothetical protein
VVQQDLSNLKYFTRNSGTLKDGSFQQIYNSCTKTNVIYNLFDISGGVVPSAPITNGITLTFIFHYSKAQSLLLSTDPDIFQFFSLSFSTSLESNGIARPMLHCLLALSITIRSGRLASISWSV